MFSPCGSFLTDSLTRHSHPSSPRPLPLEILSQQETVPKKMEETVGCKVSERKPFRS